MKFGPTGVWIGELQIITYYGVILMLGAVAAAFLAEREARRRKLNSEFVWDALVYVLVAGVIGARLWHIFTPTPSNVAAGLTTAYYLTHPLDMLNFRMGGLGIPGAVIGGALALYWYTRRKKVSFGLWGDIAIPGVALGQAIGRWGNFVNQELYGPPTDLPWGIYIEREGDYFHPLFAYESIFSFFNMFLLLWLGRRFAGKLKNGDLVLVYAITYPIARFLLDFLRPDNAQWMGINANQAFLLLTAICAAAFLIYRHRPRPSAAE